jgi:hypothetical protein
MLFAERAEGLGHLCESQRSAPKASSPRAVLSLRLLQIDIAVKDDRLLDTTAGCLEHSSITVLGAKVVAAVGPTSHL